jgi:hypothetical protein
MLVPPDSWLVTANAIEKSVITDEDLLAFLVPPVGEPGYGL